MTYVVTKLSIGSFPIEEAMRVGSGYPRNAFVTALSAADLGLADRQQVPADFPERVVGSLLAVIVSAYDDETYLAWDQLNQLNRNSR